MNQFSAYALPLPSFFLNDIPPLIHVHPKKTNCEITGSSYYDNTVNIPKNTSNKEKERVFKRLTSFSAESSFACSWISSKFGYSVKHEQLRTIAQHIAQRQHIILDRDAKRRKSVLLKWFDENWAHVFPVLREYSIEGDKVKVGNKIISSSKEKIAQPRHSRVAHLLLNSP